MTASIPKSAISMLQEHVVKHYMTHPQYTIVDLSGPNVGSRFSCTCLCGAVAATSTANSKKEAKQAAANLVLAQMGVGGAAVHAPTTDNPAATIDTINTDHIRENYVGELNEYCAKNYLGFAEYTEKGRSDEGLFVIECKHQCLVTVGKARSKKEAKHNAALEMMSIVKANKPINNTPRIDIDPNLQYQDVIMKYRNLSLMRTCAVDTAPVIAPATSSSDVTDKPGLGISVAIVDNGSDDNACRARDAYKALERQLRTMGVDYTVHRLPCVSNERVALVFKGVNVPDSLIAAGDSHLDAMFNLLEEALDRLTTTTPHPLIIL